MSKIVANKVISLINTITTQNPLNFNCNRERKSY